MTNMLNGEKVKIYYKSLVIVPDENPDSYFLKKDLDPCDNYWEELAGSN